MTTPLLDQVVIEGFRGFRKKEVFAIGSQCTILGGPNGSGKTSFFDAVMWAILGDVQRLGGTRDYVRAGDFIRNRFCTPEEDTGVSLTFRTDVGNLEFHKTREGRNVILNGKPLTIAQAHELLGLRNGGAALSFMRTRMLTQEEIAAFVNARPRDRYEDLKTLGRIFHAERATIFFSVVDNAYQKALAEFDHANDLLASSELRLSQLEEDKEYLQVKATETIGFTEADLDTEEKKLSGEILSSDFIRRQATPRRADRLDSLLVRTEAQLEKQLALFSSLLESFERSANLRVRLPDLEAARQSAKAKLSSHKKAVDDAQTELGQIELGIRRLQKDSEEIRRRHSELHGFLEGIRRHITEDRCPVCKQKIKASELEKMIMKELSTGPSVPRALVTELHNLEARRSATREDLNRHASEESNLRSVLRKYTDELEDIRAQISAFAEKEKDAAQIAGISTKPSKVELAASINGHKERLGIVGNWMNKLRETQSRRNLLQNAAFVKKKEQEIRTVLERTRTLRAEVQQLSEAKRLLLSAKEAARDAQVAMIGKALETYSPMISDLYSRLRPHKVFSRFKMDVSPAYKEGEVFFEASTADGIAVRIQPFFSMTQRNSFALCLFLALNLSLGKKRSTVFIDDPIHSMDDINILGLTDLFRTLKDHRQIVFSTHDRRIFDLFVEKLRTVDSQEGTRAYWFHSCSREGPEIEQLRPIRKSKPLSTDEILSRLPAA